MQQKEALNLLKLGKNVFLTGAAGSGKTYVLNQYIQYLNDHHVAVAKTASTGIAATHLNGVTIHAWSGIGIKDTVSKKDLEKLFENSKINRNYKQTSVLIIDEISMLHQHQLDMVDKIARFILKKSAPFGGIQVILCGDFFQLPPVSVGVERNDRQFAFEADAWKTGDFYVCYLDEQHRQGNDALLTVLNDIRSGTAGEHTKVPLRARYKKAPDSDVHPTKLYTRNVNVDAINEDELAHLGGQEKVFRMKTAGFTLKVNALKKSCLALEVLRLKLGAEVMFIKNDVQGRYVNGTRCVVVGFERKAGWPVVKTASDEIIVASPEEWQFEEHGVVRATITQVPLRLAWAITVHKSQGMTLDAAEIDLGDAFEPGMGYVALSRVRSLNGLKLMNLNNMALTVHPKVLAHDQVFKSCSKQSVTFLNTLSADALMEKQNEVLSGRFSRLKSKSTGSQKNKRELTHITTLNLLEKNLSIESVAKERNLTMGTVLNHLEKLGGLKLLNDRVLGNIKRDMLESDFEVMLEAFKASDGGELQPIYKRFRGKYSYEQLKIVRLFVS